MVSLLGCSGGSPGSVSFGQRQLEQMLDDRPDMRGVLEEGHPVREWVQTTFDGQIHGYRIYWEAQTPHSGREAECSPPYEGYPAFVRVGAGSEITPVDRWVSLVYELHNIDQDTDRLEELTNRALTGEVSADEYAVACVRAEYEALVQTAKFLEENPIPKSGHGRDPFYAQLEQTPGSFDTYCAEFAANDLKPGNYQYFVDFFNESLAPYIKDGDQKAEQEAPAE